MVECPGSAGLEGDVECLWYSGPESSRPWRNDRVWSSFLSSAVAGATNMSIPLTTRILHPHYPPPRSAMAIRARGFISRQDFRDKKK